jgi:peptidoglycan/xylan/chitin deacetylase (PgdA/CDA1 family)
MNYVQHLLRSKGKANLFSRALMIYRRFGLTGAKTTKALLRIVEMAHKHACTPTVFVTADLLDRHGELIHRISRDGTAIGIHGHYHIDFASLPADVQTKDIGIALDKFRNHGITVDGFRGPFLRHNQHTPKAVRDNGLSYVSHSVMVIHGPAWSERINACNSARNLIQGFYSEESHEEIPSLPSWELGCLQIPVSLPDDELLVDRLRIRKPEELTAIWSDMLDITHHNGELFNLLIHPERMNIIDKPLDALLKDARDDRHLWVDSLHEIARWWQERSSFTFDIVKTNAKAYQVTPRSTSRASVLLQQPGGKRTCVTLDKNGTLTIPSAFSPTIYMPPGFCNKETSCLANEGFVVNRDADPSTCSFTLSGTCPRKPRALLATLNDAKGPLVRFARWPDEYRSALSISLDLDAFTILDFVRRFRHFRQIDQHQHCASDRSNEKPLS